MGRIREKTLGNGLLTSEGEDWKRRRRMVDPSPNRQQVRGYAVIMVYHALALADRWHDGQGADVEQEMDRLALSTVTPISRRIRSAPPGVGPGRGAGQPGDPDERGDSG